MTLMILQAAPASPAGMPTFMQLLAIATAILSFTLLLCGAIVYAYKLGVLKRDGEATRADAVRANEALALHVDSLGTELRNGFKTVHRRMDRFDEFTRGVQETDLEDAAWRAEIAGRLTRVVDDVDALEPRVRSLEERRASPRTGVPNDER